VDGFYVTGAMTAARCARAPTTATCNNVVFSNAQNGIDVLGADAADVRNNLVYANGTGGIRVAQSRNSVVANNTIFGNGADSLLVGGYCLLLGRSV